MEQSTLYETDGKDCLLMMFSKIKFEPNDLSYTQIRKIVTIERMFSHKKLFYVQKLCIHFIMKGEM